ncbi:unnamed protein product [Meganyctiphanes norvegica]|uniref:Uncharacterized protein n=1 Tax=Meganyctiphanes norvegica TaxID=48144 RepID=A0AAV2SQF3_MEGNR
MLLHIFTIDQYVDILLIIKFSQRRNHRINPLQKLNVKEYYELSLYPNYNFFTFNCKKKVYNLICTLDKKYKRITIKNITFSLLCIQNSPILLDPLPLPSSLPSLPLLLLS